MAGSSRQGWAGPQGRPGSAGREAQAGEAGSGTECGQRRKTPVALALLPPAHPAGQGQACGPLGAWDNLGPSSPVPPQTCTNTKLSARGGACTPESTF